MWLCILGCFTSLTVFFSHVTETQCDCSELVSEPVGTCQDNGTLSIPNGIVTYESVSVGSEALYQCKDGFSLSGVSNRTCQGNGSWSGSQPVCRKGNFLYHSA